jgi:hypothetical protein
MTYSINFKLLLRLVFTLLILLLIYQSLTFVKPTSLVYNIHYTSADTVIPAYQIIPK